MYKTIFKQYYLLTFCALSGENITPFFFFFLGGGGGVFQSAIKTTEKLKETILEVN